MKPAHRGMVPGRPPQLGDSTISTASGSRIKRTLALVTLFGACCFGQAAFADETGSPDSHARSGTWRLNLEESIAPQGRAFNPYVVSMGQRGSELTFAYTATGPDEQKHEFGYDGKADGVVRELPGSGDTAGMKGAMILLPSGLIESRLWAQDGSYENKFCIPLADEQQMACLATVTYPDGHTTFFKQVLDRVAPEE